ncbi:hypothetical protein JCM1840_006025 [Sporobolomyces johnsonii]
MVAPPPKDPSGAKHPHYGKKGTPRKDIAPPTGAFALPPPQPQYFEDGGLRKVKPYMFAFQSWAKERWQGRTLIDIYSEFRDRTTEYYEWAIETGIIVVNNQKSTPDRIIQNGDLISNVLHRHEPPVVAGPIKIIYDGRLPGNDGETLVVEKPGSMPVHPTGRYQFNTLLEILKYDYGLPLVHTSNRLDRLTSGVMICSLTVEASKKLGAWFGGKRGSAVEKEYVARCLGRFPDGEIVCEEPLLTIDRQIGVNVVHPDGRDSKTIFNRMSYDERSNTSVVHCRPITGRSHQIRVHLQFLGHPIANDPIYQNAAAWGESGGKGGVFGADRGGTQADREERRERGEKYMRAQEGVEVVVEGDEAEAAEVSLVASSASAATPEPSSTSVSRSASAQTPSIYNKAGQLRHDLDLESLNLSDLERKSHDPVLTPGAERAIAALREVKDEADGFARERDMEGVEKAKQSGRGIEFEGAAGGEQAEAEEEGEGDGEEQGKGGFCKTCFTPLMPDPRPEQLFIWLHAMRYKTTEWDWKSELPYWAEGDYEVPLSSILS